MNCYLPVTDRPACVCCGRSPHIIAEYQPDMTGEPTDPCRFVLANEGTVNRMAPRPTFFCTECYIHRGMPLGKAPDLVSNNLCALAHKDEVVRT